MKTVPMLIVQALDPHARCIYYEGSPGRFVVRSKIEISDGHIISSTGPSADTPDEAYSLLLAELTAVAAPKYVVTHLEGARRQYRWNGAAFAEIPLEG